MDELFFFLRNVILGAVAFSLLVAILQAIIAIIKKIYYLCSDL